MKRFRVCLEVERNKEEVAGRDETLTLGESTRARLTKSRQREGIKQMADLFYLVKPGEMLLSASVRI